MKLSITGNGWRDGCFASIFVSLLLFFSCFGRTEVVEGQTRAFGGNAYFIVRSYDAERGIFELAAVHPVAVRVQGAATLEPLIGRAVVCRLEGTVKTYALKDARTLLLRVPSLRCQGEPYRLTQVVFQEVRP